MKRRSAIACALLLGQAVFVYAFPWTEVSPSIVPLREFPHSLASWEIAGEGLLEPEVVDMLQPDDYLARSYRAPDSPGLASLFVGYFRSQRLGSHPHSPRRCLPGAGWVPYQSGTTMISAEGVASFPANEYFLQKGEERIVVLYWYQNKERAVASELALKFHMLPDLVRYQRSDVALVRVIQPASASPATIAAFASMAHSAVARHFSPPAL